MSTQTLAVALTMISDYSFLKKSIEKMASKKTNYSVVDWVEKNRIMRQGTSPKTGRFSYDNAPYMREIVEHFAANSLTKKVALMKCTQIGYTAGVLESILLYVICQSPNMALYLTATDGMAQDFLEGRFDAMVEASGFSDKIAFQGENKQNKKSGSRKNQRIFAGGELFAYGMKSPDKLRGKSIKYLFIDEADTVDGEAGAMAKEGDPVDLATKRTDSYGASGVKIFIGSSPLIARKSRIEREFKEGDQRYYYVPCPYCGHYQRLEWKFLNFSYEEETYILKIGSVFYECQNCKGEIKSTQKDELLARGEWRPHNKKAGKFPSYHINALYAPIWQYPFENLVEEFLEIKKTGSKSALRTFTNTRLAETWDDSGIGERVSLKSKFKKNNTHSIGTVAGGTKLIFGGCDVQKDGIFCMVCGITNDEKIYIIEYFKFEGDTDDASKGAYVDMISKIGGKEYATKEGDILGISMLTIDSNYNSSAVRAFCQSVDGILPIIGSSNTSEKLRLNKTTGTYTVKSSGYKDDILDMFSGNKVIIPHNAERLFLRQLESEERRIDINGKSLWTIRQGYSENHYFDCLVYSLVSLDLLTRHICESLGIPESRSEALERLDEAIELEI